MDKEVCFEQYRKQLTRMRNELKGSAYSPYKPIIMISIIDMLDNCSINLFLKDDAKLRLIFHNNWEKYVEKYSPFQEDLCAAMELMNEEIFCKKCRSRKSIGGQMKGLALTDQLHELLMEKTYRIKLRSAMVSKYFPQNMYKVNFDEIDAKNDTTLRGYQIEAKEKVYEFLKDHKSVMLQMPTGTGKTRVFVSIVRDLHNWGVKNKKAVKVLVLAHRRELIEQIDTELSVKYHLAHGIIMSQNLENKKIPVQVGSVPTLNRRLDNWSDKDFDFVIVDEAHHVKADSYKKIIKEYPNAKLLGLTATPYRMNGAGFKDEFDGLIISEPVKWFIDNRFLSDYVYYSIKPKSKLQEVIDSITKFALDGDYAEDAMISVMDKDYVRANIVETYQKYAEGKKGIVYCINREHNKHVCERYKQIGVKAAAIDSSTPKEEREKIVEQFRLGKLQVLCNVNIFSEGFDCPDVEFIQLARPTKSLSMFLQQVGRGLRSTEGKDRAIFLDNVGLYNKFGFPSARRRWQHHFDGRDVDEPETYEGSHTEHEVRFFEEIEGSEDVQKIYTTENNESKYNTGMKSYEKEFIDYCSSLGNKCGQPYMGVIKNHIDKYIRENIDSFFMGVAYMIDVTDLHRLRDDLFSREDFLNLTANKRHYLTASLRKYVEFAEQYVPSDGDPLPIEKPESDKTQSDIEREQLLKEIEVFEKYHREVPPEILEKLEVLNNKFDFRKRLQDVICNIMMDSGFFDGFNMTIYHNGDCYINDEELYYDEKKMEELKSELSVFEKYHHEVPTDLLSEIVSMKSFKDFSLSLYEKVIDLVKELEIKSDYLAKVNADGDVSLEIIKMTEGNPIPAPVVKPQGKHLSNSEMCAAKTMFGAMRALANRGGVLGYSDLKKCIPTYAEFTDWDLSPTKGKGKIRWEGCFLYYSGSYIKAGYLVKDKLTNRWYLTEMGRQATKETAEAVFRKVFEKKDDNNEDLFGEGEAPKVEKGKKTRNITSVEKLRVTFPDGRVIDHDNVKQTFVEVITAIGAEKVASVGLMVAYFPLVGTSRPEGARFNETSVPEIEPGYFLNTHSSTTYKKQLLDDINKALHLGLKIDSYFVNKSDGTITIDF